jgi:hypothetical protein
MQHDKKENSVYVGKSHPFHEHAPRSTTSTYHIFPPPHMKKKKKRHKAIL